MKDRLRIIISLPLIVIIRSFLAFMIMIFSWVLPL